MQFGSCFRLAAAPGTGVCCDERGLFVIASRPMPATAVTTPPLRHHVPGRDQCLGGFSISPLLPY
jgi:hypothetical protein